MQKLIVLAVAASCVSFSALSQAAEHCPELKKIEEIGRGVFRADGNSGDWSGVLQGNLADNPPIRSFEMALAIQENAASPVKLQHCTYRVGAGKTLDMHFITINEKEFTIQTKGSSWKNETGDFGLIYNVCEKTSPENCKFTINQ